jgi:monoamine oxidase
MAATRLRSIGHEVVVLEARNRVGGRVWSQRLAPDDPATVIERGAEFVLDGYTVMRSVLDDLGLELAGTGMSYYVRQPVGDPATTHAEVARVARAVHSRTTLPRPGASIADLVAEVDADPAAKAAFLSRLCVTCGYPPERLSADGFDDVAGSFENKPSWRVAGGNQRLADGLARSLGETVHRRTPVQAVRQDADGVRVATSSGEVMADRVVLAVPLALLTALDIDGVTDDALAVWARTGLAQNAKLHLPLRTPAGPSAVQSVAERFWTWTATDGSGAVQPVLHCFAGTGEGLAALRVDRGPEHWADRAAALRPDLDPVVGGAVLTTWTDDPWARMSYVASTVDALPGDAELLGRPMGRVHLAGEHTAGAWAGLMEGALRSGVRVADEVAATSG